MSLTGKQTPPAQAGGPALGRTARARGFTIVELMLVVAILAVLAALAAPSFTPVVERWRVRQTVEGLLSTLHYARSEAIRRAGGVFIEKLPQNTNGCALAGGDDDWGCGWVVFVDANGNRHWDAGEEIQRFDTSAHTSVTRSKPGMTIGVDRWGKMDGISAMGFVIAPHPAGITSSAAKGICLSSGGRIRIINKDQLPCR